MDLDSAPTCDLDDRSPCLLLEKLPVELRLKIYESCRYWQKFHYLTKTFKLYEELSVSQIRNPKDTHHPLTLLQTCKTINSEATPVFYGMMNFIFVIDSSRPELQPTMYRHRGRIDQLPFLHHIRHLDIRVCLRHEDSNESRIRRLEVLADALEAASPRFETLGWVFKTGKCFLMRLDPTIPIQIAERAHREALDLLNASHDRTEKRMLRRILELPDGSAGCREFA